MWKLSMSSQLHDRAASSHSTFEMRWSESPATCTGGRAEEIQSIRKTRGRYSLLGFDFLPMCPLSPVCQKVPNAGRK